MNVFILHSSDLQVRIWKKICNSQKWTTSSFAQESGLRRAITLAEDLGEKLADVVLVSEAMANGQNNLCEWLTGRPQVIPFIVLADAAAQNITATQKQLAKAKGAHQLLPDFTAEMIALDAVKGLSCVAGIQSLSIDSKSLQKSIVELKPEFQLVSNTTKSPEPQATGNIVQTQTSERVYRGQVYKVAKPVITTPKKEPRRYRGQEY